MRHRFGVDVAVIISDTFGRPWRRGVTDVAIGCAGVAGIVDLRGTPDALGREMHVTEVAVVDELAAAAELVMGKSTTNQTSMQHTYVDQKPQFQVLRKNASDTELLKMSEGSILLQTQEEEQQ